MTWIPTSEKLPPVDQRVLICTHTRRIEIGVYYPDFMPGENWHDEEFVVMDEPSHWMPLPAPAPNP